MIAKGTVIGPWSVLGYLGDGCSGTVWRVRETAAPFRIGALKIHDGPKTTATDEDFRRERDFVVRQLIGGFMPECYYSGETADGTPYFVMQRADKLPRKLDRKDLKRVIDRVAAALQLLHRLGWLHCDVKRENIGLVDGVPVLLDFGSLHETAAAKEHPERVGTWLSMAPEVRDELMLDERADVYSLAVAFRGLCRNRDRRFFESLIVRSLDNNPLKRPQTMAAFRRELALGQDRLEKFAVHARIAWAVIALFLACNLAFALCHYASRTKANRESNRAQSLARLGLDAYEKKHYQEAAHFIREAIDTGHCTNAAAIYALAEIYLRGRETTKDHQSCRRLAEQAARLGNTQAKELLKNLNSPSLSVGPSSVRQDRAQAINYAQRAVELGATNALPMLRRLKKIQ